MNNPSATGPITLYHKRRARIERAKGLSHVVPALVLLSGVFGVITGQEPFTLLLGLEVLVGAAYVLLLLREIQHLRRHPNHHERVAWLELAAAGIFAIEGYHIWHRHHEAALRTGEHKFHVLPWLYAALAVWYVGMAFGIARIYERRHLHLHANGFSGRMHPFRRGFSYTWAEVDHLEPSGPTDVLVHRSNGQQQKISFANVYNGSALRDQLLAHRQAKTADAT
ncbi:hypothetical protein [Hymenobacter sp. YC55]|uniref:hypothetical protein n=1 Tax=Hymenobacter sp. YC55 TaxID=3034019 RepID=UPI0023F6803F|nr:hypothetical protein [Hymenobacter sp. YC55]MDF7812316.1 hypothetical protein [Hymenobacter sp. YC55]